MENQLSRQDVCATLLCASIYWIHVEEYTGEELVPTAISQVTYSNVLFFWPKIQIIQIHIL